MFDFVKKFLSADNKISHNDHIEFSGNFSFFIVPQIKGNLPYQNSTIKIEAFNNFPEDPLEPVQKLKIHCKWYRVVGDRNYYINDNPDEIYHFNAYDIGSTIKCSVQIKPSQTNRIQQKFRKEVAIVTIGPIIAHEKLNIKLEQALKSQSNMFCFALLKYKSTYTDDYADYQNFLKMDKDKISFQFGYYFNQNLKNFSLLLNSPQPFTVVCENFNYKVVTIIFKQGIEGEYTHDMLEDYPELQKRYN